MALPTYLELVNDVLKRLREPEVDTVSENTLSALIGVFVNDGKRIVEDSYKWNALRQTIPIATESADYIYYVTGSGDRFQVDKVWNSTSQWKLGYKTPDEMDELLTYTTPQWGPPTHYTINGTNATTGDVQVYLWPVPDGAYTIPFHLFVPQADLSAGTDVLLVPKNPVVQWAFARALVERGEDGGLSSSEQHALFKAALADAIAIEQNRFAEKETWEAT